MAACHAKLQHPESALLRESGSAAAYFVHIPLAVDPQRTYGRSRGTGYSRGFAAGRHCNTSSKSEKDCSGSERGILWQSLAASSQERSPWSPSRRCPSRLSGCLRQAGSRGWPTLFCSKKVSKAVEYFSTSLGSFVPDPPFVPAREALSRKPPFAQDSHLSNAEPYLSVQRGRRRKYWNGFLGFLQLYFSGTIGTTERRTHYEKCIIAFRT